MFGNNQRNSSGKGDRVTAWLGVRRAESKSFPTLLPHPSLVPRSLPKAGNQNTVKACLCCRQLEVTQIAEENSSRGTQGKLEKLEEF